MALKIIKKTPFPLPLVFALSVAAVALFALSWVAHSLGSVPPVDCTRHPTKRWRRPRLLVVGITI